jgi:hypothetical protein
VQVDEAVEAAKGADLPSAFVSYKQRYAQSVASTALQSHDETCWRVQAAPGPQEVRSLGG